MENTKIKNTAAVLDKVLKVFQGIMIAVFAVAAIFIPLTAIFGEKIVAPVTGVDLGVIEAEFAGNGMEYVNKAALKPVIICELVAIMAALAAGWYFLRVLREILVPMKEGRPFESGVSTKIRKLGWVALIGGAVAEIASKISPFLDVKLFDLERVFNMEVVKDFSYNIGANTWWFVIAALVLFFLSYVFRCGEQLQKEADETL